MKILILALVCGCLDVSPNYVYTNVDHVSVDVKENEIEDLIVKGAVSEAIRGNKIVQKNLGCAYYLKLIEDEGKKYPFSGVFKKAVRKEAIRITRIISKESFKAIKRIDAKREGNDGKQA